MRRLLLTAALLILFAAPARAQVPWADPFTQYQWNGCPTYYQLGWTWVGQYLDWTTWGQGYEPVDIGSTARQRLYYHRPSGGHVLYQPDCGVWRQHQFIAYPGFWPTGLYYDGARWLPETFGLAEHNPATGWTKYVDPADGRAYVANPWEGLLQEALPMVAGNGVISVGDPWAYQPPPGDRVIEYHDSDVRYLQRDDGSVYALWPALGQIVDLVAARDGARNQEPGGPLVIPFDPSLGPPSLQVTHEMKEIIRLTEAIQAEMVNLGTLIEKIRAGWPESWACCPNNARQARNEATRAIINKAINLLDALAARRAIVYGVAVRYPVYDVYAKLADAYHLIAAQTILDMFQMRRNTLPTTRLTPPDLLHDTAVMFAALAAPPPAADPAAPMLPSESADLLRIVANYVEYGHARGWSDAQICYAICPLLNGPTLAPILGSMAYQPAVAATLRGFSPGVVQDYGGLIATLNALRPPDTLTILRRELN